MKRRKAIFWNEGRSELWKRVDKGIKQAITFRRRKYEENMTARLERKTNQWHSIYKFLASDDMPSRWNITERRPNQSAKQLADELAHHFAEITNMSGPLTESDIPKSLSGNGLVPHLDVKITESLIRKAKKSNSRVNGDIPRDLVNPCAKSLAVALTPIFNACLLNKKWPARWKVETIIPIPKMPSPGGLEDIRPISMTTLWLKILESLVAKFTLEETAKNWKMVQFGGRKGSCTDNVLVNLWDKILS